MADTDDTPDSADKPAVEARPRGRTSRLTMALLVLNALAMAGFGALLYMDVGKRQQWTRAVLMRDLATLGLPVDSRDLKTNVEAATQIKHDLDPPLIQEAYRNRGITLRDKTQYVRENFKADINFALLKDEPTILRDYFQNAGVQGPVDSLDKEVARVKAALPGEIDTVASEVVAKAKDLKPDQKKALLRRILFPLAKDGPQVMALERKIVAEGVNLDEMLQEAAKRRMLFEILQAMEVFRPSEGDAQPIDGDKVKRLLLDRAADLDGVKYADLLERFDKRCQDVLADTDWLDPAVKRDNAEKRRTVAFLLLAIANVEVPGADRGSAPAKNEPKQQPVENPKDKADKSQVSFQDKDPGGDEKKGDVKEPEPKTSKERPYRPFAFRDAEKRVEAVVGLVAFNQACEDLAIVMELLERQTIDAVNRDRGTFAYPLAVRVTNAEKFTGQFLEFLKQMNATIPDEPAFKKGVGDHLNALKDKIDSSEMLTAELRKVMAAHNVSIPESPGDARKTNQLVFDLGIETLLNANAVGFLGKHQMAVERLKKLAAAVEARERQFGELTNLKDKRGELLANRKGQEESILKMMVEARAETRRLARELQQLQQELFLTQVDVAGVHLYNQYLERHLQDIERKAALPKGGKSQ